MSKVYEQMWETKYRNLADTAIRAGLTRNQFLKDEGITDDYWFKLKPKGYKWQSIQKKLGIKRIKSDEDCVSLGEEIPAVEKTCTIKYCSNIISPKTDVCSCCKVILLENILNIVKMGFSKELIEKYL